MHTKKENKRRLGILIILLISSACFCALTWAGIDLEKILNITLLFATFLALLWYTIETNLMQEAIRYQTVLSVKPKLIVFYSEMDNNFYVENIGNGTAINIRFKPIKLQYETKQELEIVFRPKEGQELGNIGVMENVFYEVLNLYSKQKQIIIAHDIINGSEKTTNDFSAHLRKKTANKYEIKEHKLAIQYEDLIGKTCEDIIVFGKDGPRCI